MENTNLMEKNRAMHLLLQKAANDVADFEYTAEHLHNMLGAAAYSGKYSLRSPRLICLLSLPHS